MRQRERVHASWNFRYDSIDLFKHYKQTKKDKTIRLIFFYFSLRAIFFCNSTGTRANLAKYKKKNDAVGAATRGNYEKCEFPVEIINFVVNVVLSR